MTDFKYLKDHVRLMIKEHQSDMDHFKSKSQDKNRDPVINWLKLRIKILKEILKLLDRLEKLER